MPEPFKYFVFLSHSAQDKDAVRELAKRLKADGLRVWFDGWVIQPGDAILRKLQEGLEQARTLVLLLSWHATAAEWVTFEQYAVRFRDLLPPLRRLLPVRVIR